MKLLFYAKNLCRNIYTVRTGGSIHDGSLFPFQKVNTLQLNAISRSPNTRRASTLSDAPHKTPSTGPVLVISQHGLTILSYTFVERNSKEVVGLLQIKFITIHFVDGMVLFPSPRLSTRIHLGVNNRPVMAAVLRRQSHPIVISQSINRPLLVKTVTSSGDSKGKKSLRGFRGFCTEMKLVVYSKNS
jgi:hypothetical protein